MNQDNFLAQSYKDAWKDYEYSLKNEKAAHWNWVIITSSNKHQAYAYQLQIDKRIKEKRLPHSTNFVIIPDPDEQRVGSGGATLNVLKYICQKIGIKNIADQKILILHSGGDSKRIPQYSACGKLFTPVPRVLPDGNKSTIFDELIIAFSGIPHRAGAGMLVSPSDTELLFNPLQLDLLSCDAAGLSVKVNMSEGKEHGVYLNDNNASGSSHNYVTRFLHKQSEAVLRERDAVDENNCVNIDTGCIWLGNKVINSLLGLICENNKLSEKMFTHFVNPKVCLSFYADFVFPLASNVTIEEYYKEVPEGTFSDELKECRTAIWNTLHGYKLSLILLAPARYIHFGMTSELFDLLVWDIKKYQYIGWKKQILTNACDAAVINAYIHKDAQISVNCYIEDCILGAGCSVGSGSIVSGIRINRMSVPDDIVLHCLKMKNGKFVCRIYGREDNPKDSMTGRFLGTNLINIVKGAELKNSSIWDCATASIWNAHIYSECDTVTQAVEMSFVLYRMAQGVILPEEVNKWESSKRHSLKSSFEEADVSSILNWHEYVGHVVRSEQVVDMLNQNYPMDQALSLLDTSNGITKELKLLVEKARESEFPLNMRIYLSISSICKQRDISFEDMSYNQYEDMAYQVVSNGIINAMMKKYKFNTVTGHFKSKQETIDLPVRINFCGSPSDAAPYCLEHGGTMFDGALLLKGKYPIHVEVKKLEDSFFSFESFDLKSKATYHDIREIRDCADPYDTFALHKAVLVAAGVIPLNIKGISLQDICKRIGGGIYLSTSVNVPKGSGLGTSSILAAACLKAINTILNQNISNDCIYSQVFAAEQLMSTGGGWQDQVGGLTPGLKYFTAPPGMYQDIDVEYLHPSEEVMQELKDRFVLIYSGQRRLARNILRQEMNQCIRNDKKAISAIESIRELCVLMKYYLERGDVTKFARCISNQFELVKTIDKGASNTCIEYIFDICEDLIDGKSICGAGGGGFLQIILKKGVKKEQIKKRIDEEFCGCGVEVWDCELI